jgi:deazaflavin-dependent oxidoreductase (nitroreductase family)
MPLSRRMADFNKKVTNHVTRHLAGWAPGFAIVHHRGRRSGRAYETPVNVFVRDGTYLFALTYGEGEWVKNVVAANGCEIRARRRTIALTDPHLFRDPERTGIPIPARWILGLVDVDEFLTMKPVTGEARASD